MRTAGARARVAIIALNCAVRSPRPDKGVWKRGIEISRLVFSRRLNGMMGKIVWIELCCHVCACSGRTPRGMTFEAQLILIGNGFDHTVKGSCAPHAIRYGNAPHICQYATCKVASQLVYPCRRVVRTVAILAFHMTQGPAEPVWGALIRRMQSTGCVYRMTICALKLAGNVCRSTCPIMAGQA